MALLDQIEAEIARREGKPDQSPIAKLEAEIEQRTAPFNPITAAGELISGAASGIAGAVR